MPAEPGLYAWWAAARALPGVAGPAHPSSGVQLLYVGIAPSRSTSRSRPRSRVLGDHAGGSTGSSTLRRSVAAMLSEREQYRTRRTSRTVLVPEDELRLSAWMRDRLSLTWAVHPEPWSVERWVIEQLGPALNQAENTAHPSHAAVRAARARWRRSAEPADGESAGGP